MFPITITKHYILFVVLAGIMLFSTAKAHADSELCNTGDSHLYFTALGWSSSIFSDVAVNEGFTPISPGTCRSMKPYGMNRVTISLFKYDKRGVLANVKIVPPDAVYSSKHINDVCVRPAGAFRKSGKQQDIISTYTPPCTAGYIQALSSFTLIAGDARVDE